MKQDSAERISSPASPVERQAYKWAMKMSDDPERHRAGLARWLRRDPERTAIYDRVTRELAAAASSAARLNLPRERSRSVHGAPLFRPRRALAMAAVAAMIVAGGAAYMGLISPRRADERIAAGMTASRQSYSTRADEIRRTRLPDGSVVTLDRDSAFAIDFTADRRIIEFHRGRVRFEVAHDRSRPFVVLAGGGSITATGTVFDVDLRGGAHVHLVTGAVDVALPARPSAPVRSPVRLAPGEQIAFGSAPAETVPQPQRAQPSDARWISGRISFEDMPLADVVAQANSHGQTKIVMADAALLREEVFADLDTRDSEQVARKLAILLDLEVDRSQPGKLILRRH